MRPKSNAFSRLSMDKCINFFSSQFLCTASVRTIERGSNGFAPPVVAWWGNWCYSRHTMYEVFILCVYAVHTRLISLSNASIPKRTHTLIAKHTPEKNVIAYAHYVSFFFYFCTLNFMYAFLFCFIFFYTFLLQLFSLYSFSLINFISFAARHKDEFNWIRSW